jgi:CRP-like cAMP-binding protein
LFRDFLRDVRGEVRAWSRPRNLLLAQLSPPLLGRLRRYLSPVHLRKNEVLFRSQDRLRSAYFPSKAVISLVSTLESGQSLAVGWVGRDGRAAMPFVHGIGTSSCEGVVQIAGSAVRIPVDVLRHEALADVRLFDILGRYAHLALVRSMQLSACNMFHSAEQRCIRWLLTLSDLVESAEITLTHDQMASMLGVHRPTVTYILRALHKAGTVHETRGRVVILDRDGLERHCCECRKVMRAEQQRLLGY